MINWGQIIDAEPLFCRFGVIKKRRMLSVECTVSSLPELIWTSRANVKLMGLSLGPERLKAELYAN